MGGGTISAAAKMMNNGGGDAVSCLEQTVLVDEDDQSSQPLTLPPLVSSYNDMKIRPLHDMFHKLCRLKVIEKGFTLPRIVVIGNQSSGKTSVIESLTGTSLPRGQGICTRVPLIIKFQHNTDHPVLGLHLEYQGKSVPVDETKISESISLATEEITGNGKEISNVALTLVVKKNSFPDLTIIDFPGIPIHDDRSNNIYEKFSGFIRQHTYLEEFLFVHVIDASSELRYCPSMRLLEQFDPEAKRTVNVITKLDLCSDDLITQLTMKEVTLPFGYLYVKNDSVFDKCSEEVKKIIFRINKEYVGFDVISKNICLGLLSIILNPSSLIVRNITSDIKKSYVTREQLEQKSETMAQALPKLLKILTLSQRSLDKVLIAYNFSTTKEKTDQDFARDENGHLHSYARLVKRLEYFYLDLINFNGINEIPFLLDEYSLLEQCNWPCHLDMVSSTLFDHLLEKQVGHAFIIVNRYISNFWEYIGWLTKSVLLDFACDDIQLSQILKKSARNMIAKLQKDFTDKIYQMLEHEKSYLHTCDTDFGTYLKQYELYKLEPSDLEKGFATFEGVGKVELSHLKQFPIDTVQKAFRTKMMMVAYWKVASKRIVDNFAQIFKYSIKQMVTHKMFGMMMEPFFSNCKSINLLNEGPMDPQTMQHRQNLENRIRYLEGAQREIHKWQKSFEFLL